ncbi:hypothetical protein FPSE_09979 [Fusarium pseudograminearum CS3096]|uniref:Uncharacterized protein n=1 Tax=Fusarium pseudograminearum (strain CS3096) TaxID=1028729 RepID=K3V949_FUSPC|nr:hypothetical protein FPSE_09979 [Fusarium pseudograminearum CS3096]EKJ69849.1 hypothetical protein FPSE_09979 [Fusarium pseudograminearum CS3096]
MLHWADGRPRWLVLAPWFYTTAEMVTNALIDMDGTNLNHKFQSGGYGGGGQNPARPSPTQNGQFNGRNRRERGGQQPSANMEWRTVTPTEGCTAPDHLCSGLFQQYPLCGAVSVMSPRATTTLHAEDMTHMAQGQGAEIVGN